MHPDQVTVSTATVDTAPRRADRWVAAALGALGLAIGLGGLDEFRYFGPATPQFWAGMAATPAGAVAFIAAVRLWRRGVAALPWVRGAAAGLVAATLIGAALRVMGPPAILIGLFGAIASDWWARQR